VTASDPLPPFLIQLLNDCCAAECGHSPQAIWMMFWFNGRKSSNVAFAVSATAPMPEYEFDQTVSW
jgi:hypothetical protein